VQNFEVMGSEESPASGLNLVRGELDVGGVEVGAGFKVRVDYFYTFGAFVSVVFGEVRSAKDLIIKQMYKIARLRWKFVLRF